MLDQSADTSLGMQQAANRFEQVLQSVQQQREPSTETEPPVVLDGKVIEVLKSQVDLEAERRVASATSDLMAELGGAEVETTPRGRVTVADIRRSATEEALTQMVTEGLISEGEADSLALDARHHEDLNSHVSPFRNSTVAGDLAAEDPLASIGDSAEEMVGEIIDQLSRKREEEREEQEVEQTAMRQDEQQEVIDFEALFRARYAESSTEGASAGEREAAVQRAEPEEDRGYVIGVSSPDELGAVEPSPVVPKHEGQVTAEAEVRKEAQATTTENTPERSKRTFQLRGRQGDVIRPLHAA